MSRALCCLLIAAPGLFTHIKFDLFAWIAWISSGFCRQRRAGRRSDPSPPPAFTVLAHWLIGLVRVTFKSHKYGLIVWARVATVFDSRANSKCAAAGLSSSTCTRDIQ